jgi:hypothetical protein
LLLAAAFECAAQSSDPGYPAPVYSNEIGGRIAPRDLGDARRTRHFYTFRGTEGDVLVTIEGSELVGDLDVFTATTQRPLIKITLLGDRARLTKSFYVRKEETLILRVEARAAGDVEGSYRITFGGSFAPAPTDLASAPQPSTPIPSNTERRGKNTRRVTSTGARIEEPAPVAPPAEEAKEEAAAAEAANAEKTAARKPPTPRRGRGARPSSSRTRAGSAKPKPTPDADKSETAEAKSDDGTGQPGETKPDTETKPDADTKPDSEAVAEASAAPSAKKPPAPRRRNTRPSKRSGRNESAATGETAPTQPAAEAQPAASPAQRLVILTKTGETIERDMSTVRRVTVENNQLVVVTKDGKVSRQPMANVLRMSIEP